MESKVRSRREAGAGPAGVHGSASAAAARRHDLPQNPHRPASTARCCCLHHHRHFHTGNPGS
uniref:Uncharacterized protein n=1 Tax=Arundo donax TaxID=35708 RepID=A0A0A9HDC6_ARUDO